MPYESEVFVYVYIFLCGNESIPINTIFRGMNIHLPAIFMFTRGTIGFDTLPCVYGWSWLD